MKRTALLTLLCLCQSAVAADVTPASTVVITNANTNTTKVLRADRLRYNPADGSIVATGGISGNGTPASTIVLTNANAAGSAPMVLQADRVEVNSADGSVTATGGVVLRSSQAVAKRQIQVKARFLERTGKDGAEDVLSAPTVVTLDGQQATIEIIQEIPVAPVDPAVTNAAPLVKVGARLEITPRLLGGRRILLQGLAEIRERAKEVKGVEPAPGQVVVNTRTVNFSLIATPGATVLVGGLEQDGRTLTVELTAREIPSDNAAPTYWQAFAVLPDAPDAKDDAAMARWVTDAEPALKLLRTAAAKRDCDWELDYGKGPELVLPHLGKARALANAALARAKRALATKTNESADEAAADLAAVLHLSRHLSADPLLISQLVRVALEKQALDIALAPDVAWSPAQAAVLRTAVEATRPCPDLADCLEMERSTFVGWFRAELKRQGVKKFGESLSALGSTGDDKSLAFWKGKGERELHRMIETADADYQEFIRIARLPAAEYGPAYAAWEAKLLKDRDVRVLSALIMPSVGASRGKLNEANTRMEKARAALKERAGGGVK